MKYADAKSRTAAIASIVFNLFLRKSSAFGRVKTLPIIATNTPAQKIYGIDSANPKNF